MNTMATKSMSVPVQKRGGILPLNAGTHNRRTVVPKSKKGDSEPAEASTTVEDIPSYFQPAEEVAPQTTYQAAPAPAPVQQAPPPTSFWSGVPPLVWIGVGVLLGNVVSTALEFVKGGPQKMQEMAMQQMMKQMMKQAGAPGGAGSPFGMPGAGAGNPFGMPGAGAASPFGAGFPPTPPSAATSSPIDTTATPFTAEPKKEEPKRETVTPEVKVEGASASSGASSSTKKKSAFVDVDVEKTESSQSTVSTASTFTPPPPPPPPPSTPADASSSAGSMLDMLKNPEMQKMLYPYLPEPMRNPETFEWMLNSPEYRAQLEGMLSQQMGAGAPQAVQDLMKDADMSPEKMQEQFDALGMTPEDFVQKVMSDPDLATSMTKPNVMAAIAECTKNPMAIFQYQNDEEVMRVFEKMSGLFPQAAGMGGMPGMPGMPPQNKN